MISVAAAAVDFRRRPVAGEEAIDDECLFFNHIILLRKF